MLRIIVVLVRFNSVVVVDSGIWYRIDIYNSVKVMIINRLGWFSDSVCKDDKLISV